MGYRSEVHIVIRGPLETLESGLAALRLTGDEIMLSATDEWCLLKDPTEQSPDRAVMILHGDHWKWYESYPDVQAHEAVWKHFAEMFDEDVPDDKRTHGMYIRIGEENDDVVQRTFGDDAFSLGDVSRAVVSDYQLDRANDVRGDRSAQKD